MRAKRLFGKVSKRQQKRLTMGLTDENAAEVLWFMQRYPLVGVGNAIAVLQEGAERWSRRTESILSILDGDAALPPINLAIPPREYQSQAAALAVSSGALLLADDVGLGKTISGIATAALAGHRALVVVQAHLVTQWKQQFARFLPDAKVVALRKGQPYDIGDPSVVITSYHKLAGWVDHMADKFGTVIFDECQELRHEDTKKHDAASAFARNAQVVLGLSATPIYNYGSEFFSVFSVLAPNALGDKAEFEREWCAGKKVKEPKEFGSYLRERGLMLRRSRADVGRELAPVTPFIHEIETSINDLQSMKGDTIELAKTIVSSTSKPFDRMQASSEFSMRLRQETGIAKAPYVAEFVRMLVETDDQPVVLFGWHRIVYDIWFDRLRDLNPVLYTGTESATQKEKAKAEFLAGRSKVMMISLRSGSGLDGLQNRCSRVVFGELDWSPGVHEQGIGRVWRDGQELPVMAYFVTATDGSDPVVVDTLGLKQAQIDGVMRPRGDDFTPGEVDPDHIRRLATDFLSRRGVRGD